MFSVTLLPLSNRKPTIKHPNTLQYLVGITSTMYGSNNRQSDVQMGMWFLDAILIFITKAYLQHTLIGFYNRDEKCLQRGTDWVFK